MDLKDQLNSCLTINSKQQMIRGYIDSHAKLDEKKLIASLESLSDRYLLAEDLLLANNGIIDRIKSNYRFNKIQDEVHRIARDTMHTLENRERNGQTFEDVAYPILAELITSKEPVIFRELRSYVKNQALGSLELKREFLLAAIETAILILNYSYDPGLHTVKELVKERRFSGNLHSRCLIGYCSCIEYLEPFKNYVASVFQEEEIDEIPHINLIKNSNDQLHFYAMRTATSWADFSMHAEKLLDSSEDYKELVTNEFTLMMNQPLLNIFKLLRFPGNRTLFTNWIKSSPIPPREQEGLFKRIHTFSKQQYQNQQFSKEPNNNKELFTLFYNFTVDATYKYKLISSIGNNNNNVSPQLKSMCLDLLKERQYKVERQYITQLLALVANPKRGEDLVADLESFYFSIRKHVGRYKIVLRKKIQGLNKDMDPRIKKSFAVLFELIKNEKALSPELLWELYNAISQKDNSEGLIKLAHFISAYYITLNAQYICKAMKNYITSMSANDNLYITKLLSHETKESIFERIEKMDYTEAGSIVDQFIKRGERERLLRIDTIRDLIVREEELDQMRIGQHELEVLKYGNSFTLSIFNEDGKLRFQKTENNLNNYFDFESFCKRYNIQTLLHIRPRQLKLMYQQAHVNLLNELLEYLEIYANMYAPEIDYIKLAGTNFEEIVTAATRESHANHLEILKTTYTQLLSISDNTDSYSIEGNQNLPEDTKRKIAQRMQSEFKSARHAIQQLDRLFEVLDKMQLDQNLSTLERIDNWATRPVDMPQKTPAPELQKVVIEDIKQNFESLTNERLQVSFLNSTANENQQLYSELNKAINYHKSMSKYLEKCMELETLTSTIKDIRCLEIENPILNSIDPNQKFDEIQSPRTSDQSLKDTVKAIEHEVFVRKDYLDYCMNRTDLATSILIYGKEIAKQEKEVKGLIQLQSKLELELAKRR